MISVIVPVYKAEKVIARCIESVIAQEYKDWELILVDDGSPDRSGEICDEYAAKDDRIRVVHQENAGASAARNQGIDVARGEYICFIDADDYVKPFYLGDFRTEESSLGFAIQGMTSVYPIKQAEYDRIPSEDLLTDISGLLCQPSVWELLSGPCCKLFGLKVLDDHRIRFEEGLNYAEDEVFVKQYLCYCPDCVRLVSSSNYYYIKENTSSLSGKKRDGRKVYQAVVSDYCQFMKLQTRVFDFPVEYYQFHRNHKANDFYSSIYNVIADNNNNYQQVLSFVNNIDREIWIFYKEEKELPISYKVIRHLLFLNEVSAGCAKAALILFIFILRHIIL